jgi:hypothetical protein
MGKVCAQYADSRCALAAKVTRMLPEAIDRLPDCDIRPQCRWFAQEGEAACLRCPQVVTEDVIRSYVLALAADPTVPAGVGDDDKSRKGGQTR